MRFVIFVIDEPGNLAKADEIQLIDAFNEKLQNDGHWVTAAGIREPGMAKLIDNRNQRNLIEIGSLFDSPEHYSGFWLIEAGSEVEATQLALEGSFACNRRVELRPYIR